MMAQESRTRICAIGEGGMVGTGSEYDLVAGIGEYGHQSRHVEADVPLRLGPFLVKGAAIRREPEAFRGRPVR